MFGLTTDRVVERAGTSADQVGVPTLGESLLYGSLGFLGASLLVYGTVAFMGRWMYTRLGEGLAYTIWAALFIIAGGATLSQLIIGPERMRRFYPLFTLAFFLYAAAWVAAYFPLRNVTGEALGSLAGTLLIAVTFAWAFGAWDRLLKMWIVLFLTHSAGYFLGSFLYYLIGDKTGMMLWGVSYGWMFGLGLGYVLYAAQQKTRHALTMTGENRI